MPLTVNAKWFGDKISKDIVNGGDRGLLMAAEYVLEESNRIVPHNEGMLQDSGYTAVDTNAHISEAGYDTPYAVRQHEELGYRHPNGRKAKYLEDTVINYGQTAIKIIRDSIGKLF
jgi:hypothetical protein